MKNFISSPISEAANNIVRKPRVIKTKNDYTNFIQWLDTSNKDLKKIKLPEKKKLKKLYDSGIEVSGLGGGKGFDLFESIGDALIGGGTGLAGGLGLRSIIKKFRGGKPNLASPISKTLQGEAGELTTKVAGKEATEIASRGASRGVVKGFEHIALPGKPIQAATPAIEDAAKVAALRGGGEVAAKGAGLASKLIPGLATAVNLGVAGYRFSQGDIVGGSLSALSAIPIVGWAAVGVDLAREFGAFEGTPLGLKKDKPKDKIEERLKEQEKRQKEEAAKSKLTFADVTNKFDRVVSKFEKISFGITGTTTGKQNVGQDEEDGAFQEPQYPPLDPSQQTYDGPISGDTFFPLPGGRAGKEPGQQFGAPRDDDGDGRSDRNHAGLDMIKTTGDIAAPVAAYKTGKVIASVSNGYNGYVTIDHGGGLKTRYYHTSPIVNVGAIVYGGQQIANIYPDGQNTHLHFEIYRNGTPVNPLSVGLGQNISAPLTAEKAKQQFESSRGQSTGQASIPSKGYLIVPGHAAGDGTKGEKEEVKKLALEIYNKIKRQNPSAPVQFMDMDSTFPDTDPGWEAQKKWYETMKSQGYEVVEIHLDEPNGVGAGVIRPYRLGKDLKPQAGSALANSWISGGGFAYPEDHKDDRGKIIKGKPGEGLALPARKGTIFELGRIGQTQKIKESQDRLVNAFLNVFRTSPQSRQPTPPAPSRRPPSPPPRQISSAATGVNNVVIANNTQTPPSSSPSFVPVPVQSSGGGQSVAVLIPSEGQILNSLFETMHLSNLSSG